MTAALTPSAQKIQSILNESGLTLEVVQLPSSTRTAQEAADSIGCKVEQIAKSVVFRGKSSSSPILVLASGPNRVNEKKVAELVSEPIEKADADFVRTATGFAIGGVPPLGHTEKLRTFIDEELLDFEELWAAAGTPNAVFKLKAKELKELTAGTVASVT